MAATSIIRPYFLLKDSENSASNLDRSGSWSVKFSTKSNDIIPAPFKNTSDVIVIVFYKIKQSYIGYHTFSEKQKESLLSPFLRNSLIIPLCIIWGA